MKTGKGLYEELEKEVKRLSGKEGTLTVESIFDDYILPHVSIKEQIEYTKDYQGVNYNTVNKIFTNIIVLRAGIKILALMEASDNVKEFKDLADKASKREKKEKKEKSYTLTEFDKFLKAVSSVPKPTKEELKEHEKKK